MNKIKTYILVTVFIFILVVAYQHGVSQTIALGEIKLSFPLTNNNVYPIYALVDHDQPWQRDSAEGTLVLFNGKTYNDCINNVSVWLADGKQGPYCYDGHEGIDWPVPENTNVLVADSGEVEISVNETMYGNRIVVLHDNGYRTNYAHLAQRLVDVGDKINAGDVIGLSGNTGTGAGGNDHLHFDVTHNGLNNHTDPFGWQGNTPDPLINYRTGEISVCLWADDRLCNDIYIEDGDIDAVGNTKFLRLGNWKATNGNNWTMQYISNGDGSARAYWLPLLERSGTYEVFAFIPPFSHKTSITYTIHDQFRENNRVIDQSNYTNEWVSLGVYRFKAMDVNNWVRVINQTSDISGTKTIVIDSMKFRQYRVFLPIILKTDPLPTPTPTATFTPSPTATSTPMPTATACQSGPNRISKSGFEDEFVWDDGRNWDVSIKVKPNSIKNQVISFFQNDGLRTTTEKHEGQYSLALGGFEFFGGEHLKLEQSVYQNIKILTKTTSATLTFWLKINSTDSGTYQADTLTVDLLNATTARVVSRKSVLFSNVDKNRYGNWKQPPPIIFTNLQRYQNQPMRLLFYAKSDDDKTDDATTFLIDQVSLKESPCSN